MNVNQQEPIIQDKNENKLNESSSANTSPESVSTAATDISPDVTPESVPTNLDSKEYTEDFQSSEEPVPSEIEGDASQEVVAPTEAEAETETPTETPTDTPAQTVDLPVKNDIVKTENKTQKQYDMIIHKANNLRKQFTKKRKTMHAWDDNKKHEWRTNISDTLISVIRQSKNKHTLKHHHVKLHSMRNLFNHYLNSLSTSKQSKKGRTEKKQKK